MKLDSVLSDRPVWVTGLGAVTPLGGNVAETMAGLWAGERGIRELQLFNLKGARSSVAGEVQQLERGSIAARTDAMAVQAAREALGMAGLSPSEAAVHMVVGGTTAGMFETEELLTQLGSIDLDVELRHRLRTHPLSSTVDVLCREVGPFASARTICCACTSGVAALALAWSWIRSGRAEVVLAGGADALCRLTYGGFGSLAVLDAALCRPFDATRAGLNLGEGAGFLVLESQGSAERRGAKPLARIVGVALGGEAHHITNPEPGGATAADIMRRAIQAAQLTPADIGYVNAHGTATPHNDAAESAAIRACFGEVRVPVSSSKGQIGHTLGAAGAIEAVITVKTVQTGTLPPTIGLGEVDPACELNHLRETVQQTTPLTAMSNSFGFGGTGGAVVISSRPELFEAPPSVTPRSVITGAAVVASGRVLQGAELAALLVPVTSAPGEPVALSSQDPTSVLDAGRSRRMDRSARLSTLVMSAALEAANSACNTEVERTNMAAVSGTAFGNVDGSMRFMKRMLEKGAQFASPVDFPNLVPSSPVSHAAIYCGLRGPALATPDLSATAESALSTGLELIEGGVSHSAVVGSVEEVSELAERVLAPLLGVRTMSAHSEGASALVLERAEDAQSRGKRALAAVVAWRSTRQADLLQALPAPTPAAIVVAEPNVDVAALLAGSAWQEQPRFTLARAAGEHVGLGGVALAAAAERLAGAPGSALILGAAPDRAYAFLLESQ